MNTIPQSFGINLDHLLNLYRQKLDNLPSIADSDVWEEFKRRLERHSVPRYKDHIMQEQAIHNGAMQVIHRMVNQGILAGYACVDVYTTQDNKFRMDVMGTTTPDRNKNWGNQKWKHFRYVECDLDTVG